jgi:type III secretory pathway component EscV
MVMLMVMVMVILPLASELVSELASTNTGFSVSNTDTWNRR